MQYKKTFRVAIAYEPNPSDVDNVDLGDYGDGLYLTFPQIIAYLDSDGMESYHKDLVSDSKKQKDLQRALYCMSTGSLSTYKGLITVIPESEDATTWLELTLCKYNRTEIIHKQSGNTYELVKGRWKDTFSRIQSDLGVNLLTPKISQLVSGSITQYKGFEVVK